MSEALPPIPIDSDGDWEYEHKLIMAKDLYMRGLSIEEVAERTEIKKWTIHKCVFKGHNNEKPWAEQRKEVREEFVKECTELTKISMGKAWKATADAHGLCMASIAKDLELDKLKPTEKIKLLDSLTRSVKELHGLYVPAFRQPLVNIALQQATPKLNEAEVMEKLIDWGLAANEESKT